MNRFPKPSELMRSKRPYLYSDSERHDAFRLSESELRHHLASLTDRNQHKDFEVFCRKLCEREVCPNLRPQTGPEGGGDGKVDTETFPVDEAIAERWYVSNGRSGQEKWAFAFSTQTKWAQKARSDVKGIVATGRRYDRIICVTSRPARQRDRLQLEENLTKSYGIAVNIFDGEWIVDRVFSGNHKDLAHEYLRVGSIDSESKKLGPNDFRRQQSLDEIEARLKVLGTDASDLTQAVSDTFEAARLSRELERPRFETEGRFQRAATIAKKYGTSFQVLRATYEHAWTEFWWFDDIDSMLLMYDDVERLAFETDHAAHISRVANLFQLVVGQFIQGQKTGVELNLFERSARLKEKLNSLSKDNERPSNALYAETLLVLHDMNVNWQPGEKADFDRTWVSLSSIIDRASGLGEYPADMLDSIVEVMSEFVPDSAPFDAFVEKLAEFMAGRQKELTAGRVYLAHGERKLDAERPIDAIKWLGRAVLCFSKDESRAEQAKALYFLSVAYRGARLLWASRACALAALVQYLAISEIEGEIRVDVIPTLALLTTISIELGHVNDILSSVQFVQILGTALPLDAASVERLRSRLAEFDHILACFFANLETREFSRLEWLPDVLDKFGLLSARLALLYQLGHVDILSKEGSLPSDVSKSDVDGLINQMASQPACHGLPRNTVLFDKQLSPLKTTVLGVDIEISAEPTIEGYLQAETYAAALEGFSATLLGPGALPCTESLTIKICRRTEIEESASEFDDDGSLIVSVPENWRLIDTKSAAEYNKSLLETIAVALSSIAILRDAEKTLRSIILEEQALERATLFCRAGVSRNRAMGAHVGQASDWTHLIARTYSARNGSSTRPGASAAASVDEPNHSGRGARGPKDIGNLQSHRDVAAHSIINMRLWDAAGWQGMLYAFGRPGSPPFLGLIFENEEAGRAIFREWRGRYGEADRSGDIRISLVKGISKKRPFSYRGVLSKSLENVRNLGGKMLVAASRSTTMEVDNHRNLDAFLQSHRLCGHYILFPVARGTPTFGRRELEFSIMKSEIFVRDAWQIGPNDPDLSAIREDDDVILPEDELNPPVAMLLAERNNRKSRGN